MALYNFSFGSNMSSSRLLARLPEAKRVGTAILKGYELTFDMVSTDGSAKCSVRKTDQADALVYGVVYQLNEAEKSILDDIEGPRYDCVDITVENDIRICPVVVLRHEVCQTTEFESAGVDACLNPRLSGKSVQVMLCAERCSTRLTIRRTNARNLTKVREAMRCSPCNCTVRVNTSMDFTILLNVT